MHDYLLRELLPLYRDLYVFGTLWSNSYASSTQISDFHQFVSRRKNYESSSIQYFRFLLSLGFSSRSSYLLQWSSRIHLEWNVLVCLHRDSFSLFVKKKKKNPFAFMLAWFVTLYILIHVNKKKCQLHIKFSNFARNNEFEWDWTMMSDSYRWTSLMRLSYGSFCFSTRLWR